MQHEERTVLAKNRSMEVSALGKVFQGDLDWIVMKALEKDRTHRYETVNGLVADIQRHLNDEPVTAIAPTFGYQLQKFYRRNRGYMRAAAVVAGLLILTTAVATVQAVRATRAEQRANRETVRGDDVARVMIQVIEKSIPEWLREGRISAVRSLMDQAETLATEGLSNAPTAELQLRTKLTEYYLWALNDFAKANDQGDRVLEFLDRLSDEELGIPRAHAARWATCARLWNTPPGTDRAQEAIDDIHETVAMANRTPEVSENTGSIGLASLALWAAARGETKEQVESALVEAIRQYTEEPPSIGASCAIRQAYFWVRARGQPLPQVEEILPDIPPFPSDPEPFFVWTLHRSLLQQCRYARTSGEYGDLLKLLFDAETKAQNADWPKQFTVPLNLFKVWALAKTGELDNAGDAFLRVGSSEEADLITWAAATVGAGSVSDSAGYNRLRRDGIARFASNVEGEEAYRFLGAVLLQPLSEDLAEIVNQVLERVLKAPSWRKHWSASFELPLRGWLAVRTGDYGAAVRDFDQYKEMKFNPILGLMPDRERITTWGWQAARATALVHLGRNEEALKAYQDARAVRAQYSRASMDIFGVDDVWLREAQAALRQKGILNE
jgi:tetratricopeptide (TPR) repeat protein